MMIHDLPQELIHLILRHISRDLKTLQAAALTCHYILPIAREFLFTTVGCQALDQESLQPYLEYVVELRFSPNRFRRPSNPHVPFHQIFKVLRPDRLPRLTTFTFLGIHFWDIIQIVPSCIDVLGQFKAVTELTLSGISFLELRHVQAFVCALPNLEALNLHRVTFAADSPMARTLPRPVIKSFDNKTRPRLKRLAFSPDLTTRATFDIVEWLLRTPTAETLEELVVPYSSRATLHVLGRFGPSVKHLSLPLRTLDQNVYEGVAFGQYTELCSLTIFMDSYNVSQGAWYLLAPLLQHGVPVKHLRRVTIDVRVEFQTDLSAVVDWAALERVNDLLEDEEFEALEELEFIVQLKEELGWDPHEEVEALLERVEQRLYCVANSGKKITTRYWRVDEFYDTIVSLRTGIL